MRSGAVDGVIFFFVVLVVDIDRPDSGFIAIAAQDVFHRQFGRQHRMILIVIAVHTITPHQIQIAQLIDLLAQRIEFVVAAKISRIGFFSTLTTVPSSTSAFFNQAYLDQFILSKGKELRAWHLPQRVAFRTEIFQTQPDRIGFISHQIRAPVIKDLQSAQFDVALLNINPVIRQQIVGGAGQAMFAMAQFAHQHAHGNEIAILQASGNALCFSI